MEERNSIRKMEMIDKKVRSGGTSVLHWDLD